MPKLSLIAAQYSSPGYNEQAYPARLAIDGILHTDCLSADTGEEWLSVAISECAPVRLVRIINRSDRYSNWLANFEVWIGDSFGSKRTLCGSSSHDRTLIISCGGAQGSFITLQHRGSRSLTIAELEVYELEMPMPPALPSLIEPLARAQYGEARLSRPYTAYNPFPAALAIDEDVETFCATAATGSEWLSIQVYTDQPIVYIELLNRRDAYRVFLQNFQLWLGDTFGEQRTLCGSGSYDAGNLDQLYTIPCTGARGSHLTLQHQGNPSQGVFLSIVELIVYMDGSLAPLAPHPTPLAPPPHTPPMPSAPGQCAIWCATNPKPPATKCTFVACSSCQVCHRLPLPPPPPTGTTNGRCASWCATNPSSAQKKCTFNGCSGCQICSLKSPPPPPTPTAGGRCASWCATNPSSAQKQCTFNACNGCLVCDQ